MKKFFMNLLLCLATVLCLMGFAACGETQNGGTNGTYYLYCNGGYAKNLFFKLEGDKWTDDDGATGTFTISNGEITFYYTEFGETFDLCDGTISNGVLYVMGNYYCKEGKTPTDVGNGGNGGDSGSSENTAVQFTVTYDANGGTFENGETTITETINANATLTAPQSPKKANYTFDGWATSAFGTEKWNFAIDQVTKEITLYAVWTQQSAAILSVDGASINGQEIFMLVNKNTDSVSLSNKVVCSDNSVWKLYYDKLGQMEIPTKIAASTNGSLLNGDNVFYVVVTSKDGTQTNLYELNVHRSYAVSVRYYDGETLLKTDTAYTGYEYTANYTPNITGYTFNDWNYTKRVLWDNLNLYVDKTANTYTVTYDVNGGDELTTTEKTVTYDSNYTLAKPTRTGYTFLGWYQGSTQLTDEKGKSLEAWKGTNSLTAKAKWQANEYTVTLSKDISGGSVSGGGAHAYDSNVTITASTYSGYTWLGWYDKDDKLVTMEFSHTFQMGFDVQYTAKWMNCPVTLERNMSEAGSVTGVSRTVLGAQTTITATTNEGYTWLGWYNGETLLTDELSYTFEMFATNVTYTAKWAYYTATTNTDLSVAGTYTKLTDKKIAVGTETTLAATTYSGYTWLGWYNGETLLTDEMSYTFKMPAENVTYTAKWTYYTATTNTNLSAAGTYTALTDKKIAVGTETTITATTNEGYTWLGWYNGETLLTDELSYTFKMPAENVTYTAKWEMRDEMENFKFESTATTCTITGVTDKTVTEIVVPDYVTEIKGGALSGCSSLESITLPFVGGSRKTANNTYQYPFGYIFGTGSYTGGVATNQYYYGSSTSNSTKSTYYIPQNLKMVTITGGNILYCAFYNCDSLTSVVIGDSVTSIGDQAFNYCDSLTSVEIGDSVTSIGSYAFSRCDSLTSIEIPDSVTSIGSYAFYYCDRLTSIVIPDSVMSIGKHAFSYCTNLTNIVVSENNTAYKSVDGNLYSKDGTALIQYAIGKTATTFTIPDSVTSIGEYAFAWCDNLTSVVIGDGVTTIGDAAFYYCDSLTSIEIPDSVTSIGEYAFWYCDSLTGVYITDIEAWYNISFGDFYANPLYYAKNLYLNNELVTELEIPNTITEIKAYAFYNCDSLTSIEIPDSVTYIGNSAFSDCDSLTSITIPDSVTSIGYDAFYGCSSLTSITFEEASTWYVEEYDSYVMISYQITVEDPFTNAKNFTSKNSYWYKQ